MLLLVLRGNLGSKRPRENFFLSGAMDPVRMFRCSVSYSLISSAGWDQCWVVPRSQHLYGSLLRDPLPENSPGHRKQVASHFKM